MACYSPITGYRTPAGKVTFKMKEGYHDMPVTIACGQCRGCRLERSRQWAVRCVHEAQMHDSNSFITLTYDDDHLPATGSLDLRDWQLFAKKLRKKAGPFRFYHCGEYGDLHGRPHYHAILFGLDFPDQIYEETKNGNKLYSSPLLAETWRNGRHRVGAMTFESAAYVARYCMKKINGDQAEEHYQTINTQTGEVHQVKPEYTTMSRGGRGGQGGIGSSWFAKFGSDIFPSDQCVINGKITRPPRYYDGQYELENPSGLATIKLGRRKKARPHRLNNTPERLRIRETIQEQRTKQLHRPL